MFHGIKILYFHDCMVHYFKIVLQPTNRTNIISYVQLRHMKNHKYVYDHKPVNVESSSAGGRPLP